MLRKRCTMQRCNLDLASPCSGLKNSIQMGGVSTSLSTLYLFSILGLTISCALWAWIIVLHISHVSCVQTYQFELPITSTTNVMIVDFMSIEGDLSTIASQNVCTTTKIYMRTMNSITFMNNRLSKFGVWGFTNISLYNYLPQGHLHL